MPFVKLYKFITYSIAAASETGRGGCFHVCNFKGTFLIFKAHSQMTKQSDLCPFSIAGAAKTGCGGLVDVCCRQGAWFYSGGPEGGAVLLRPT